MRIRVLGEVCLVAADGSVAALPGTTQPALLAALAARAGETVGVEKLADLLWGNRRDASPENPTAALHSAVFKLRARLSGPSGPQLLHRRGPGYVLDLGADDLDADVFSSLVMRARELPPHQAAEMLREALALWHGSAYGEFGDCEIAHLEALRLEELRRSAVEQCAEALVDSDQAVEAVSLLRPFLAEHPLRDNARRTLMMALHEIGRTAEALDEYQLHRRHLADELGLEPSAALASLQVSLLQAADTPASARQSPKPRPGLPGLRVRYLPTRSGHVVAVGSIGSGAPVVVLLGWVASLDVIASGRDPRSSILERLAADLSLTLYDRAGTGLSAAQGVDFRLEASVAELTDVVRDVGAPVALLAMSSCGPVAVAFAHRYPELVDSLVLFGTFASGPATFTDLKLRDLVVGITRAHWGIGSKILADLYRPGISDDAARHLAKVLRDSADADVASGYLETIFDQDVSGLLPAVTTPALVLHYRSDRLIPFAGGRDLAAGLPDATFLPLDGRMHLPDAADLDTIEREIVRHVRRHATG